MEGAGGRALAADERVAAAGGRRVGKLQRSADGRYYNTAAKVEARIGVVATTRRVTNCLHTTVVQPASDKPLETLDD
ncbi:hypothetical protein [Kitasatospora aureofaciens]|uniref:hypothetical protein n=1 Tax=Kitasatospora aureofaciens TaxID=1894 RepID=UPI0036F48B34